MSLGMASSSSASTMISRLLSGCFAVSASAWTSRLFSRSFTVSAVDVEALSGICDGEMTRQSATADSVSSVPALFE